MRIKELLAKLKPTLKSKEAKKTVRMKNEKNRYIVVLRLLSILVIFFLVCVVIATVLFVYQTVMNTLGQVQSIALYQNELRVEVIDFTKLEKIEKDWEEKNNNNELQIKKNPFIPSIKTPAENILLPGSPSSTLEILP